MLRFSALGKGVFLLLHMSSAEQWIARIVSAPKGEGILGPDDEGRPLATGVGEGLLQVWSSEELMQT